jgi:peptide/nickel transport system permease protein
VKKLNATPFALGFASLWILAAAFSDFLSSNPPAMQNLDKFYHPPTRIHILDRNGKFQHKPFFYQTELIEPLDAVYEEDPEAAYHLEFFFKGYPYRLFGLIPTDRHLVGKSREPRFYPLGTDELGRDVFSRVLAGTRTSLIIVGLGVALYALLGLTIGAMAGILGGWLDSLLMRLSEFVLALPALYLLLALRALLPMRISFVETLLLMVGIIAGVAWPPMARGVRGLILQLKNAPYVEAARSLGATRFHIFARHMLPALLPFTLMQVTVAAPIFLLGELTLSFLNVGFRDSGESWGAMLRSLKDTRVLTDFWWNLLPLGMIFMTLLSLNILGNRLRGGEPRDQIMRL